MSTTRRIGVQRGLRTLSLHALIFCCAHAGAAPLAPVRHPLYFEINRGQLDAEVGFLARGVDYSLALTPVSAQISLPAKRADKEGRDDGRPETIRITPVGTDASSQTHASMRGVEPLPGKSHYFRDDRSERWLTGIEHFSKVIYPQLYPGIDLQFRGDGGRIEFDFLLQPGAKPEQVRMRIDGVDRLVLDAQGDLRLIADSHELVMQAPRSFQEQNGSAREVATRFVLLDRQTVGFLVGAYDTRRPLMIDPILDFSSHVGGSANDIAHGVAFDGQGNIYVVGETFSTDFPTRNPYQANLPENGGAFVMKLDAITHDVVYATYIGSSVVEARGIAVDAAGSAYIVGDTSSTAFPLMNAYQTTLHGLADIFVTKLSPAGDALAYSTYLGGASVDRGRAIAVDASGDVYIAGVTGSEDFPLANPFQAQLSGSTDAYAAKLSPARGTLDYSTYLGGGALDYATSVVVGADGRAVLGGYTSSANFPLRNPLQASKAGSTDAFVARLSAQGGLNYSSYLGGTGADYANAVAIDATGNMYLAGQTESANFPLAQPLQPNRAGIMDAFVCKLNPAGTALLYSTYIGGSQGDLAYALRVDASGNAYLAGLTDSSDFPTAHAMQTVNAGGSDAFAARLPPAGANLVYSTYLGGTANDYARGLAIDAAGDIAVAGSTTSGDFPHNDANQPLPGGNQDGFIALLLTDSDDDGIADRADNCPAIANTGQANLDQDAAGDACDPDIDGDGLENSAEQNLGTDPAASDSDGDGLSDGQEVLEYGMDPMHSDTGDLAPRNAPDGQVNLADLLMLMRYLEGMLIPDTRAVVLSDINKDGTLDVRDAVAQRRMLGVR